MDYLPDDFPDRIKKVRGRLGLTQERLAEALGVSFATVNRWEKGRSKPSQLAWTRISQMLGEQPGSEPAALTIPVESTVELLDFTADPEAVRAIADGERLSFGHIANPTFATEISQIDPLPHQRIAVYDHMIHRDRLRFLLADDAGAGKTIMTGLYIREMLSRRLIRRILIVAPAGLVGNWLRELQKLFNLRFRVISGADARASNPFAGEDSDRLIVSVDTLASTRVFARLRDPATTPYDLVVFDEAHKLSADRGADLYVRRTDRYRVAEAIAGVNVREPEWELPWSAHHLLLLTATPHMGKDYPYYALWRLLEPDELSTLEAFHDYPPERRSLHFIRRTKEEMVFLDGKPLYPKRNSDTLGYELTQGDISEQTLYDETTDYLQYIYNKAKLLNRTAARLAMSVFQRRLASSTLALWRSFERRVVKLTELIDQVQSGKLTMEQLLSMQRQIREEQDVFESKSSDEEYADGLPEENERAEDDLLKGVIAASLADLVAERDQVIGLRDLAKRVYDLGTESKFEKLREILIDPKYVHEKLIVFTEHRDTLEFLVRRLEGMGYTGQIAQIHGGMHYTERDGQVERFRKLAENGGARFLICTDAAGEGINLQFCWIMVNYDIPWNPARLEQRMGRIHRYGQKHDPVVIMNLVAPKTREGRVLKTLLDKLERIRKELKSDKVFDVIGRVFEGVSIKQYMEMAVTDEGDEATRDIDGRLTKEQVEAILERERVLFGTGGDVAKELPRLREETDNELYRRLLPGYVRRYVENAAPLIGVDLDGDPNTCFAFRSKRRAAADPLLMRIETYAEAQRQCLTFIRPTDPNAIWLHPGEPVFEAFRSVVFDRLSSAAQRGAVFVDPTAERPYLFHVGLVSVVRQADPTIADLAQEEVLECRLIGIKQSEGADLMVCPVEHLLLLKGGHGIPSVAQKLAVTAKELVERARAYLIERVARELAVHHRDRLVATLPEREGFIRRGFDYQEAELAAARAKQTDKARAGNLAAQKALAEIKNQQKQLASRRTESLRVLHREPELIAPRTIDFIAHALVVPSTDPAEIEQFDWRTDQVAMSLAWAFEESAGALVRDVHTPELALAAGLNPYPGFDLHSVRPFNEKRSIEVKGRAGVGSIEVTDNEWSRACNLRQGYWLYVVYDCATSSPRLERVQDPFGSLLVKAKGGVLVSPAQVRDAARQGGGE